MSVAETSRGLALTIRQAHPDEGPLLHILAIESGKWEITGMDWSFDPSLYWLVAEYSGQPVGCIQSVPGVPFGHIEFLCVSPSLSHTVRAVVARDLCERGRALCRSLGSQFVSFTLQPGMDGWEQVLAHRGAVRWFEGGISMLMRA